MGRSRGGENGIQSKFSIHVADAPEGRHGKLFDVFFSLRCVSVEWQGGFFKESWAEARMSLGFGFGARCPCVARVAEWKPLGLQVAAARPSGHPSSLSHMRLGQGANSLNFALHSTKLQPQFHLNLNLQLAPFLSFVQILGVDANVCKLPLQACSIELRQTGTKRMNIAMYSHHDYVASFAELLLEFSVVQLAAWHLGIPATRKACLRI